ncbi:MAG TPA: hypothetical protein VJI67_00760, partial [archaeon]|nr:hypothetical protein [archaeon]
MNLLQHPGRIAVLFAAFAFFSLPSSAQTQYSLPALNCAAFTSSDSFGVAQQYARVLKGDVDPAGKVVVSLSSDSFDSFAVARGADQVIVPISSTSFTPASGGDFREVIRLRFFWAELKKTNTLQFFTSNNKLNVETLKQKLSSKKLDLDSVELFIDDLVVSTQVALTKAALESPTPLSPADQGYPRDAVVNQLSLLLRNRELVVGARDQYLASPSQERFAAFDSAIQSLFSQVTELQNSSSAYLAATKNLQNAILTYARDNPEEINNADATNLAKSVASPFEEVQFVADIVSPVVSFKEEFWTPRLAQVSPEGLDAVEASFSGID